MPSYVIHLAVAKKYLENHKEEDFEEFYRGVVAPDLADKKVSHYGEYSSSPDLNKYYNEVGLDNSYNRGYFLHLVTDYLFYNKFLQSFSSEIYEDYNKINSDLIEKYNISIPKEIEEKIKFKEGIPSILDINRICKFIDAVGQVELERYKNNNLQTTEDVDFFDI